MSKILWLASYPKSGNTWLRIFLANLRRDHHEPVDINDLDMPTAASRQLFDDAAGVEASDLTEEEIARCRPHVFQRLAALAPETIFLKTHDAYVHLPDGEPAIPGDATSGAIYIVRNPLDVAISFAHHFNRPVDIAIAIMGSKDYALPGQLPTQNLSQRLLSWSEHVLSWIDRAPFPVHEVRYEDMSERPLETFTATARFCGLRTDGECVARAIRHASFEQLRQQESARGFQERPEGAAAFFREGRANGWREVLSKSQVDRIVAAHGNVMRRFGYLDNLS